MQIKKLTLFSDRVGNCIWGFVCAFFTIAPALAIRYNYFVTTHGIPVGGWVAMIATFIFSWTITLYRYYLRKKFLDAVQGYTDDGSCVVSYDPRGTDAPLLSNAIQQISTLQLEVVNFWCKAKNERIGTFLDYINGGAIAFTTQKIDLTSHAPTGPLAYQPTTRWAVGATAGNWSTVEMNKNIPWTTVCNEIRHEMGHQCLSALGIDGLDHHNQMHQAGFNF